MLVLYVEVSLCSCLLVKAWQSDAMHGEIGFGDKNFNYKHCTDFKFNVNDRLAELILWVCVNAGLQVWQVFYCMSQDVHSVLGALWTSGSDSSTTSPCRPSSVSFRLMARPQPSGIFMVSFNFLTYFIKMWTCIMWQQVQLQNFHFCGYDLIDWECLRLGCWGRPKRDEATVTWRNLNNEKCHTPHSSPSTEWRNQKEWGKWGMWHIHGRGEVCTVFW